MTGILDRVARSARTNYSHFQPKTADEFFGLRLATHLGDGPAAGHYVELTDRHPRSKLLAAYARALAFPDARSRRFHLALEQVRANGNGAEKSLAAIRIERRAVAVAVFVGDYLKYADARQLASTPDKAAITAISFVNKFWDKFHFRSAAFETIPTGDAGQRVLMQEGIRRQLDLYEVGTTLVRPDDVISSFGFPPLRSRDELREVIGTIYPVLEQALGAPWTYDAAALGLYVQTERRFHNINQTLL